MKIGKIKFSICTFQFAISNIAGDALKAQALRAYEKKYHFVESTLVERGKPGVSQTLNHAKEKFIYC